MSEEIEKFQNDSKTTEQFKLACRQIMSSRTTPEKPNSRRILSDLSNLGHQNWKLISDDRWPLILPIYSFTPYYPWLFNFRHSLTVNVARPWALHSTPISFFFRWNTHLPAILLPSRLFRKTSSHRCVSGMNGNFFFRFCLFSFLLFVSHGWFHFQCKAFAHPTSLFCCR